MKIYFVNIEVKFNVAYVTPAHHVPCLTRKYVVLRKNSIRVYHFGTDTCAALPPSQRQKEKI